MILTCPACGTQYVVKDGAIPEGGRKVRCASCRHSWHQDATPKEALELVEPIEPEVPIASGADETAEYDEGDNAAYADERGAESDGDSYPAEDGYRPAEASDSPIEPAASEPAWDESETGADAHGSNDPYPGAAAVAAIEIGAPDDEDDDFSPFAERGPAARRRRSPLVAGLVVVILVAALAAAFWFLAPAEWKARIGLTAAGQTPLQLMMTHSDRQALASGNELLAVSGRVINPTSNPQRVPPIQAELRGSDGKLVYRWTIAPPTQTLAPGASARFNSAEVNVPAGGEELTVSLGAPAA